MLRARSGDQIGVLEMGMNHPGEIAPLAALAKETAIVTPAALFLWELVLLLSTEEKPRRGTHARWLLALAAPVVPLALWYLYHYWHTGFIFGNPEFLRYNATANLGWTRILLSLWHRTIHLTVHMNLYVPVMVTFALSTAKPAFATAADGTLRRPALPALTVVLLGNLVAFSILGGALLTRYLLPMYPLVLLLCVAVWAQRMRHWWPLAVMTGAAFLAGLWVDPPYAFAPEDNLTYRDMIVLHEQAINYIERHYPAATVLTAWPASAELTRPELGYDHKAFRVAPIEDFSAAQVQKAATDPGSFDTALIFSTKWVPPPGALSFSRNHEAADSRYFDFHRDLSPAECAAILHGEIVWQARRGGEWVAVLHFNRSVVATREPAPLPAQRNSTPAM